MGWRCQQRLLLGNFTSECYGCSHYCQHAGMRILTFRDPARGPIFSSVHRFVAYTFYMKATATQSDSATLEHMPEIETILTSELTRADALAIGELLVRIWPKPGVTVENRANKLQTNWGDTDAPVEIASRSFVIRDSGLVIGHAMVFPRTIGTTSGDMTIAALGLVCTDPDYRGQKLGEHLVRAAWHGVDVGLMPFSLFQTSARAKKFYDRFGCLLVDNPVIDSTSDSPDRCPFKDDHIVRYPGSGRNWPEGPIDLRGPGY